MEITTEVKNKIDDYIEFKTRIPLASSQMLRVMSKMEIEMMTKDVILILDKKYKLVNIPDTKVIENILTTTFDNSIIRSDSELRTFLDTTNKDYTNLSSALISSTINTEFKDLTLKIKAIYNQKTTNCYADFPRRCTEDITKELRKLNNNMEFELMSVKIKMQIKKELSKVLQKFLDGAYKTIHTQIIVNMKRQIDDLQELLK